MYIYVYAWMYVYRYVSLLILYWDFYINFNIYNCISIWLILYFKPENPVPFYLKMENFIKRLIFLELKYEIVFPHLIADIIARVFQWGSIEDRRSTLILVDITPWTDVNS